MKNVKRFLAALLSLWVSAVAVPAVQLPGIFGTHMVMPREAKAPVWSWAPPGAEITVDSSNLQQKLALSGRAYSFHLQCNITT